MVVDWVDCWWSNSGRFRQVLFLILKDKFDDHTSQDEMNGILRDYVGRETPLYFAQRLSERYKR